MSGPQIENEMLSLGVYALVVRGQNQDLLMGKQVQHYVELPGLESLLQYFIADLDNAFHFIYDGNIAGFLNDLENKFHLNFLPLQENLENNIQAMQDFKNNEIMVWYLIITKMLETMREQIFETYGWPKIRSEYESITQNSFSDNIKSQLMELDNSGNEDLSILYNLIFVQFLAKLYQQQLIQAEIAELIKARINHLTELL